MVSSRTIAVGEPRALTADAGWAHSNGLPDSFWTVSHGVAQLAFSAVAIGAGIIGDLLLWRLRPSAARPLALRTIAAAVPMAYFVLYFAVVDVRYGFGWTVTFIAGSVIRCGVVKLLLSFVALPPAPEPAG